MSDSVYGLENIIREKDAEIERLQNAIIKAANAMADGEPYGHVVSILESAVIGRRANNQQK